MSMASASGRACNSRPCLLHQCQQSSYAQCRSYAFASSSQSVRTRRRPATATSSSAQNQSGNSPSSVYDRARNRKQLAMLGQRTPRSITVVVGPRSSGKSTLLQDFVQQQTAGQSLAYMDCRTIDASTPTGFARALVKLGLPAVIKALPSKQKEQALQRLGQVLAGVAAAVKMTEKGVLAGFGLNQQEMTISLADTLKMYTVGKDATTSTEMGTVFDLYSDLLDTWAQARAAGELDSPAQWPVLVVDEANVLMSWQDKHPTELQQLLRFFVAKTKQQNAAHVLLCTSEYGFMSWLDQAIGDSFWRPAVIGDFTQADARGYLEDYLGVGRLAEEDWAKVYEVCGGNPGFLGLAADAFADPSNSGEWDAVLKSVWRVSLPLVEEAALGCERWTAAQYADAALLLLASSSHAVPMQLMRAQLGRHITNNPEQQRAAGKEALAAMVQGNALSLRPFSHWAEDLPVSAFGSEQGAVVTAPSSVQLYCMGLVRGKLEHTLQEWEQRLKEQLQDAAAPAQERPGSPASPELQQVRAQEPASSAQQRPSSPSSPEVQQVRRQIKDVEDEIKEVSAEVKAAKLAGDRDEVARLGKEKEQLRQKEQSLREELLLLLKAG